jgi:adenylate cyclase
MITPADIRQGRILIVDDQPANVFLLGEMLGGAGYVAVTGTSNPHEVHELHRRHSFDLILLDLQMPGHDGFRVMEELKKVETSGYLPVLALTGQPDLKLRALQAGAKDFLSKPFDLGEVLARVHNMLEVRLLHLESKSFYDRVVAEQKLSERLLLNVLPHSIANRLKGRPEVATDGFAEAIADSFPEVTVLFADLVDFTKFSETLKPEILVALLNDIFTRFDSIADHWGLEKIKTIGDSYMAAAGLPIPVGGHPARAANMALDMIEAMHRFNERSGYQLSLRIGLATGPVVAGVIGKRKFLYDLWGDAVNTASRMESHSLPGRIQLTEAMRLRLDDSFQLESRGLVDVKGKGVMPTWFLNGRRTFSSPAISSGPATGAMLKH